MTPDFDIRFDTNEPDAIAQPLESADEEVDGEAEEEVLSDAVMMQMLREEGDVEIPPIGYKDETENRTKEPPPVSPPRRQRRSRLCYYQHSERFIMPGVAAMAIRHYNETDKPVSAITKWINEKLTANGKPVIEVVDFFFLLVERFSQGKIKDRKVRVDGHGEITIDQFNRFYLAWKSGASSKECAEAIGRHSTTYTYHNIFAPLNKRDKKIRQSAVSNSHLRTQDAVLQAGSLKSIFGMAERRVIGGRLAFVLFADKLSGDLQKVLFDAVPVLRVLMEHVGKPGDNIRNEDAPHARPKDGVKETGAMLESSEPELDVKDSKSDVKSDAESKPGAKSKKEPEPDSDPDMRSPGDSTINRLAREGHTSGHFRVGDLGKRPNFGAK